MTDPIETEARELMGTPTCDPGRFGLFYHADKAIRTLCVILRHRNEIMAERDSTLRERNELRVAARAVLSVSHANASDYEKFARERLATLLKETL